jgi:TRAP-type C4-dicarboxylate transport system permease small subunit
LDKEEGTVGKAETNENRFEKPGNNTTGSQPAEGGDPVGKPAAWRGIAVRLAAGTRYLADGAGHLAAVTLLVLSFSIVLGITLRIVHIDNSWTYDLDLFSLAWLAFIGTVLTSLRDHHVTAGIALENFLGGRGTLLSLLRFAIVAAFLLLFIVSGYRQAVSSFVTHETTLDVVEWPVWVEKAALPLGAVLWLVAEIHKLLRRFIGTGM